MANPVQHKNDMKLVDEVDGGVPVSDADDEDEPEGSDVRAEEEFDEE